MTFDALDEKRICYYVDAVGQKWVVRFDHTHDAPQEFVERGRAVESARLAAEARWEVFGCPSCVKIRGADGLLVEDSKYG